MKCHHMPGTVLGARDTEMYNLVEETDMEQGIIQINIWFSTVMLLMKPGYRKPECLWWGPLALLGTWGSQGSLLQGRVACQDEGIERKVFGEVETEDSGTGLTYPLAVAGRVSQAHQITKSPWKHFYFKTRRKKTNFSVEEIVLNMMFMYWSLY